MYFWRGRVAAELESRPETWATLSRHFFTTFPQLEDARFSHIWGGAIDTCSRFCVFWGTAKSGLVAYAAVPWFVHVVRSAAGIATADPRAAEYDIVDGVMPLDLLSSPRKRDTQ